MTMSVCQEHRTATKVARLLRAQLLLRSTSTPAIFRGALPSCVCALIALALSPQLACLFLCAGWSPLFIRLSIVMSLYMPAYEQVRRRVLKMGYFE